MSKHSKNGGVGGVYFSNELLCKNDEKSLPKPQPKSPPEKPPPKQLSSEEKYKLMLYLR